MANEVTIRCSYCTKERTTKLTPKSKPRIPAGWHSNNEAIVCPVCWNQRYILRAVSIPVAQPLDCTWDELRAALKPVWAATTSACNWMMTEFYARDVRRNGQKKMPSMPHVYLYPEARPQFPALPSTTVASLENSCKKKYRALRYDVVWTAAASLPTYRYPTPYPVSNQSWHATIEQDRPIVSLRLGDNRIRLRLKSGPQFHRQYGQFQSIARGEAVQGEAAIYQQGSGKGSTLMVKLVAWLPRQKPSTGMTGTLRVHTDKESLLVAVNAKDEALWRYNGDHLRRWTAEHRNQLQRWNEDAKYENRPVPTFSKRRKRAALKFRNRMDSATHEIAAQLAGYAARRKFAEVQYDDREHGYCEQFPWFRLKNLMSEKLDEVGIKFVAINPSKEEDSSPSSTEEE